MDEPKRRGRKPKPRIDEPQVTCFDLEDEKAARKALRNKKPDIDFIRSVVLLTLKEDNEMVVDHSGLQYAHRYGSCRNALRVIADELGVII